LEKVIEFWVMEMGVDGFRLDAAQYLVEEGQRQDNTQSTHAWYQRLRKFINKLNPDILLVGEIWNSSQQAGNYVQGDELDLAFDFDLAKAIISAAGGRIAEQLNIVLDKDYSLFQDGTGMANFLTNHDMVRAMNSFSGDASKAKSAATILFTLPGTPFMYYGEEIGMTGEKPDPRIRTPMQWSSEELAGFTSNKPWEPINSDPGGMNVAAQINDPASLFSHYRTMIGIRRDHPALRDGDLHIVETGNRRVFAILRSNTQESVLVVVNLANEDIPNTTLSLKEGPLKGCYSTQSIFGDSTFANIEANRDGGFDEVIPNESLPANSNFIVRLVPCS
jgi:glycosidase